MQDRDRSVAPDLNLPQPPHDLKAEQAVLGALLLEKKVAMPVFQMLKAWCFYETVHQQIFEAMQALFARNIPIDVLTLTTELRRHNLLDVIGGSYYLTGLADLVPSTANVQYYVEVVLENARTRKQIDLLVQMLSDRCNGCDDEVFSRLGERLRESHTIGRVNKLHPTPLSQIQDENIIPWQWQGYLAKGHFTLLMALWKIGKTTLLAHLFKEFENGGELAGRVEATKILLITEESSKLWRMRRDKLDLADHIELISRPFKVRPTRQQWEAFVIEISKLIQDKGFGLVVFDTISKLWPVKDEKDAVEMGAALMPLYRIVESGHAVLLVHHPRKGDGSEGQASRGSGELPAFVDIIIEMRRFAPENREDTRRVLTAYSRFDETPPEVVLELTDAGYKKIGTRADARQPDRLKAVTEVLNDEPPGRTVEEISALWPKDAAITRPGKRTLETDLQDGVTKGLWFVAGKGRKGDPYRYRLPDSIPAPI